MAQEVLGKKDEVAAGAEQAGGVGMWLTGQTNEQPCQASAVAGASGGAEEAGVAQRRSRRSCSHPPATGSSAAAQRTATERHCSAPPVHPPPPGERLAKPPGASLPPQPEGLPPELPPLDGGRVATPPSEALLPSPQPSASSSTSPALRTKRLQKMKTHPCVPCSREASELAEDLGGEPPPEEPFARPRVQSMPLLRAYGELTPLLYASAMRFDLRKVQELIASGAAVNAPFGGAAGEPSYVTMLHAISGLPGHIDGGAPEGSLAIMDALLRARANLNPRSSSGSTPLIMACARKNIGAAARLLQWKADLSPFDDSGYDCLMWAIVLQRGRAEPRPCRRGSHCGPPCPEEPDSPSRPPGAAGRGSGSGVGAAGDGGVSARLVRMLLDASAKAEAERGHGGRPHYASCAPRLSRANLDLENWALGHSKGAIQDKMVQRLSPMLVAVTNSNHEAAAVLVESGMPPLGLHQGVRAGALELVKVLLSGRADPLEKDAQGETPMDIALQTSEDSSLMDALREAARYSQTSPEGEDVQVLSTLRKKGRSKGTALGRQQTELPGGAPGAEAGRGRGCLRCLPAAARGACARATAQARGRAKELSRSCRQLCRGRVFQGVTFGALLGALFIPDLWVVLNKRDDVVLDVILLHTLAVFIVELLVQMVGMGCAYMKSFFFYTDLVGACSLLLDLSAFRNIMGPGSPVGDNVVIIRAARAARLGATAGRFTKLVKLLRFLNGSQESRADGVGTAKGLTRVLVSRLSILVSCLIIILLVVLPLFEIIKYPEQDWAIQMWAAQVADAISEGASDNEVSQIIQDFRTSFQDKSYHPHSLFWQNGSSQVMLWGSRATLWPRDERAVISGDVTVKFDFAGVNRQEAGTNLASISFTIGLMVGFTSMISQSVSRIALVPLECVLSQVRSMGKSIYRNVESMNKQLGFQSNARGSVVRGEEDYACEIALLDCVVRKLAALSEITVRRTRPNDAQALQYLGEVLCVNEEFRPSCLGPEDAAGIQSSTLCGDFFPNDTLEAMAEHSDSKLCSWDFNSLGLKLHESCAVCSAIIERATGKMLTIDDDKLHAFVNKAASGYLKGPQYHNWSHAVDVTHVMFMLLQRCSKNNLLMSWLEDFALLVSAACHDIGHPGVTNDFMVQTSNDLAIRYNDTSPLENMHCARLFEMVTAPSTAIFSTLSTAQYKEVRGICIEAILHTDNKHHVDCVRRLQMFGEMNSEVLERAQDLHFRTQFPARDEEDPAAAPPGPPSTDPWPPRELLDLVWAPEYRAPLRNSLLHFADISNPVRPFHVCRDWAIVILEEFFAEGDLEKQRGLPVVALHDRERTNLAFSQIGFIDFFAAPLVFSMVRLLAPLAELAEQLVVNANLWAQEWLAEAGPPEEEAQGVSLRVRRLEDRASALLGPRAAPAPSGASVCPSSPTAFNSRRSSVNAAYARRSSHSVAAP